MFGIGRGNWKDGLGDLFWRWLWREGLRGGCGGDFGFVGFADLAFLDILDRDSFIIK